jgi:hypothetical protein
MCIPPLDQKLPYADKKAPQDVQDIYNAVHRMRINDMQELYEEYKRNIPNTSSLHKILYTKDPSNHQKQNIVTIVQVAQNIQEKITALAESLVKRFALDAEKNDVLNYEHFSGYYSGEAEKTFEDITKAIEGRQAVVGGTYNFVGDNAELAESGEPVFDGIVSRHEYSIIGVKTMTVNNPNYHKDGDERPTITHKFVRVRNPWASTHLTYVKGEDGKIKTVQQNDNSTVGIEEYELNDFMNRFDRVYYAGYEDLRQRPN